MLSHLPYLISQKNWFVGKTENQKRRFSGLHANSQDLFSSYSGSIRLYRGGGSNLQKGSKSTRGCVPPGVRIS